MLSCKHNAREKEGNNIGKLIEKQEEKRSLLNTHNRVEVIDSLIYAANKYENLMRNGDDYVGKMSV